MIFYLQGYSDYGFDCCVDTNASKAFGLVVDVERIHDHYWKILRSKLAQLREGSSITFSLNSLS